MGYLVSLDMSCKSTGWCLFYDEEIVEHGTIGLKKQNLTEMYELIKNKIDELHKQYGLDLIVLEDIYLGINKNTYKELAILQGAIMGVAYERKIVIDTIYPNSWRSALGIKGRKREEYKTNTKEYVENLNIECGSEDEYDAVGIGLGYMKKNK